MANLLVILGFTSLIWPVRVVGSTPRCDIAAMIIATAAIWLPFALGTIARLPGAMMPVVLISYMPWAYLKPGTDDAGGDDLDQTLSVIAPTKRQSVLLPGRDVQALMERTRPQVF